MTEKKVPVKKKTTAKKKAVAKKKPVVKKPAKRKTKPVPSGGFFFRDKHTRVVRVEVVQVTTVTETKTSMKSPCPGNKCPNHGKKCWKGCLILSRFQEIFGTANISKNVLPSHVGSGRMIGKGTAQP